jgi:glycosyltransferase involved in cell wall biosynthesis
VRVISTNRHNRSVARNAGAAIARGKYLHFLDDDDWILPDAFESFQELAKDNFAAWLYGAFRLVNNEGATIAEIYPEESGNCFIQLISWEWLPLQASIIRSDAFFKVGGFASLDSLLGGFEDIDLSRQIARYYDMAMTPKVVTCIRAGDMGSTTNYNDMFKQNRQSRDKALNLPGAFNRMIKSVRSIPSNRSYWYGRIVYYYLGSVKRNLLHRRLFNAVSRAIFALAGFFIAARHILSTGFWRGLLKPHIPLVWIEVKKSGQELFKHTRWNKW